MHLVKEISSIRLTSRTAGIFYILKIPQHINHTSFLAYNDPPMSLLDTLQNLTSKRKTSTKQKKRPPRQEVLPFGNEKKYHLVLSG